MGTFPRVAAWARGASLARQPQCWAWALVVAACDPELGVDPDPLQVGSAVAIGAPSPRALLAPLAPGAPTSQPSASFGVQDCPGFPTDDRDGDGVADGCDDCPDEYDPLQGALWPPTPGVVLTGAVSNPQSVFAADLDGDGDADVLSASQADDDMVAWYENLGGGVFGAQQIVTLSVGWPSSVYAADLDGDGDPDVLAASWQNFQVAWFENQGGGVFVAQQVLTNAANGANSLYATDLDGDGDMDVLSSSEFDDEVAWYENLGGGVFGAQQVITNSAAGAQSVFATDLDGDGDADVLSASEDDDEVAWYENLGGGVFGAQQIVTNAADSAQSVFATDLDGDGDADVLSASSVDDEVVWYENHGGGFPRVSPEHVIESAAHADQTYATDLDGDGDADVLSASIFDRELTWSENLGNGVFGDPQLIANTSDYYVVYATDLDGDGDADVLSGALKGGRIGTRTSAAGCSAPNRSSRARPIHLTCTRPTWTATATRTSSRRTTSTTRWSGSCATAWTTPAPAPSDESGAVSIAGSEWERVWADEAVARDDELEQGGVEGIPAASAFEDAREALAAGPPAQEVASGKVNLRWIP